MADGLNLGKLLRVRNMVIASAQVEATHNAQLALYRAYQGLRTEMLVVLSGSEVSDLRDEFERLFPDLEEPREVVATMHHTVTRAQEGAIEAQAGLRKMEGWIQGLIDEQTLEQRLRMDAEEKAKFESKRPTGFAG